MSRRNGGRRDVKYASNPPPPRHMRFGPRAYCQQTGFRTYRDRLVRDETGLLVDPRYGGFDIDDGAREQR